MDDRLTIDTGAYRWSSGQLPGSGEPSLPGELRVTGFATGAHGIATDGQLWHLARNHASSFGEFRQWLETIDGHFSLIALSKGEIWLACSISRSYPLFYLTTKQRIRAGDSPLRLLAQGGPLHPDEEATRYFLHFGVTPAGKTLAANLRQVRPGEIVRISEEDATRHFFIPGAPQRLSPLPLSRVCSPADGDSPQFPRESPPVSTPGINAMTRPQLTAEAAARIRRAFAGILPLLENKRVLLPLTSGYDSRLLACLLRESGHTNVVCATWGRPGNSEAPAAARIARQLGFPHLTVDYDLAMIGRTTSDAIFHEYIDFAGHLSSMPFMQDYPAIRHLLDTGAIDRETIVMPGHPGDFLRGSHLYTALPGDSPKGIFRAIITRFGTSYPSGKRELNKVRETFRKEFFRNSGDYTSPPSPSPTSPVTSLANQPAFPLSGAFPEGLTPTGLFRSWDLEERQCKLIANSTLLFDFFGLRPVMPLFNRELTSWFLSLPLEALLGGSLYYDTLATHFFRPLGCAGELRTETAPRHPFSQARELIISTLPRFVKTLWYPMNDDAFYREITTLLMQQFPGGPWRHPRKSHFYNCTLTQWYLHRVSRQLTLFTPSGK